MGCIDWRRGFESGPAAFIHFFVFLYSTWSRGGGMTDIHLFNSYTAQIDKCCKASKAISIIRVHLRFI